MAGQVQTTIKTVSIPDAIIYDENQLSSTFANNDGVGFAALPKVIRDVTCTGDCVAIEKSTFSNFIGVYSFAWQMIFYGDISPTYTVNMNSGRRTTTEFFLLYKRVMRGAFIATDWHTWSDLIAGEATPESVRAVRTTQYFNNQFRSIEALVQ